MMSKVSMVFGQVSLEDTEQIMPSTEINLFTESCHMDMYGLWAVELGRH